MLKVSKELKAEFEISKDHNLDQRRGKQFYLKFYYLCNQSCKS